MGVDRTTAEASDVGAQEGADGAAQEGSDRGTQELLSAPSADRCVNCESPLASDQRYCLECGERRGKARFSFEALNRPVATAPVRERRRRPHLSSSVSLILGVATLLLAMGVGVLIGHNNNTKAVPTASGNQTIKVEGLGNGGNNNGNSSNTGSKAAKTSSNAFKAPPVKLTPKVAKKVSQARSKVLGSGAKNLAPPTVQVGQSCSHGAGCDSQSHKFTGNYFGTGG